MEFLQGNQGGAQSSSGKAIGRITRLVMQSGLAKTRKDADFILIGAFVIFCVVAVLTLWPRGAPEEGDPSGGVDNRTAIIEVR